MPASIDVAGADVTLHVYGTNFVPRSQIIFNGGPEATTFVSTTELTTVVVGATATTPGAYPVHVHTPGPGGGTSAAAWFFMLGSGAVTETRQDGSTSWQVPVAQPGGGGWYVGT